LDSESDYIIYVDESGDHSLLNIDSFYPLFVLVFCIFKKTDYANLITPLFTHLKFEFFGHDLTVLHTREIRKSQNEFSILLNENTRLNFFNRLNDAMETIPFTIVASVIDKYELKSADTKLLNPYHVALEFCLENTRIFLEEEEQSRKKTHLIVEERGKEENRQLQTAFQTTVNETKQIMPLSLRFANKKTNVIGLQIADLVAYPIGRHLMNPDQPNRSYDILKKKLWKWPDIPAPKIYPEKRKTPVTTEV
jgi:hypothetical protein